MSKILLPDPIRWKRWRCLNSIVDRSINLSVHERHTDRFLIHLLNLINRLTFTYQYFALTEIYRYQFYRYKRKNERMWNQKWVVLTNGCHEYLFYRMWFCILYETSIDVNNKSNDIRFEQPKNCAFVGAFDIYMARNLALAVYDTDVE